MLEFFSSHSINSSPKIYTDVKFTSQPDTFVVRYGTRNCQMSVIGGFNRILNGKFKHLEDFIKNTFENTNQPIILVDVKMNNEFNEGLMITKLRSAFNGNILSELKYKSTNNSNMMVFIIQIATAENRVVINLTHNKEIYP